MAGSVYLRRVNAINRNQGSNDVERGMQVGQQVGKLLGGLSEAIKGAQKDSLANQLMTQQNISNQPGAGQTIDLGTLPSDGTGGGNGAASDDQLQQAMAASRFSTPSGNAQDLGQLPSDSPMTPGPSGAQEPIPGPQVSDDQLSQAISASRLGGGPTVGSVAGPQPGGPQPAAQTAGGGDSLNLSGFGGGTSTGEAAFPGGGSGTVGGLIGTGGVQGLQLQKEMAAQKIAGQNAALSQQSAALKLADARAKASGTGIYSLDAQTKRLALAKAQSALLNPKGTKTAVDKTSLATNMDTEPVEDQNQLVRTYEATHGKGSYSSAVSALNEPAIVPDPANPGKTIPNPNAPLVSGNSVTLAPSSKKPFNLQLQDVQTLARQANVKRIAQGQSPLPVPGEDPNLGSSRANPIPVKTKLDGAAVPHGKWIQTPTGAIIQRP